MRRQEAESYTSGLNQLKIDGEVKEILTGTAWCGAFQSALRRKRMDSKRVGFPMNGPDEERAFGV